VQQLQGWHWMALGIVRMAGQRQAGECQISRVGRYLDVK
jgi:hypothetical protein